MVIVEMMRAISSGGSFVSPFSHSWMTPIYYGAAAIKGIMVYGDGFSDIWGYLAGLTTYALVLYVINTQALKKFRKL